MESRESASNGNRRIRLFLLADQALFRAGLGRLLALEPDFELVGESAIGGGALELLRGVR